MQTLPLQCRLKAGTAVQKCRAVQAFGLHWSAEVQAVQAYGPHCSAEVQAVQPSSAQNTAGQPVPVPVPVQSLCRLVFLELSAFIDQAFAPWAMNQPASQGPDRAQGSGSGPGLARARSQGQGQPSPHRPPDAPASRLSTALLPPTRTSYLDLGVTWVLSLACFKL